MLAPSLLSADFSRLGEEARAVEHAGADWLHFDVMDNHYVPNLTVGPMVCQAVRRHVHMPIDVHLMVEPVDALLPLFAAAGANLLTFHPEASRHVDRTLSTIRELGCKAGLVLNPATPVSWLDHVMDRLDLILLMGVNPGFGGQTLIASIFDKLRAVRARIDAHQATGGAPILLEVDGGVHAGNIGQLAECGADVCVVGNAVFSAPDADGGYQTVLRTLRNAAATPCTTPQASR
ncbi:ribulose-phosphate 3-epimerase [Candidatus Symbiobacter mobilis CR]|uniref:Ribulose-phosphate 3-epimerase n=2 Tax=Candidatus Symbiobacter TaxID=1436289 RepID=U5NEW7_9BURK|nr:ribulose-phosphate 3-epimerase [Candidatus Symbiobacter mobilis CR]